MRSVVNKREDSHTWVCAEMLYEVLMAAEETYDLRHDLAHPEDLGTPSREDYVRDVIKRLQFQLDTGFWSEAARL